MSLVLSRTHWWEDDLYLDDSPLGPLEVEDVWGPKGPALVKVYADGSTQRGWGINDRDGGGGFMRRYEKGEFLPRRALNGYPDHHAIALVMRSAQLVCIDIDGKNGGLEHISKLGALPRTLAETSKSGSGYHLFYRTREEWSDEAGFAAIRDQIAIQQGVDIRGVGCVYHYPSQRWNTSPIAELPAWLEAKLTTRTTAHVAAVQSIQKVLSTEDAEEILLMHANLLDELKKPIPAGKRNNTLFAIGSKLKLAEVPDWDKHILDRAIKVGLDVDEANRLVRNIEAYA